MRFQVPQVLLLNQTMSFVPLLGQTQLSVSLLVQTLNFMFAFQWLPNHLFCIFANFPKNERFCVLLYLNFFLLNTQEFWLILIGRDVTYSSVPQSEWTSSQVYSGYRGETVHRGIG